MAVHTIRTDDVTGEPEATTVVITVNGEGVELDLAPKSAQRLAKALEPFWSVGTPHTYDVIRRKTVRERRAKANGNGNGDHTAAIDLADLRQWAATNDIAVPQRGRIPGATVELYLQRD